MKRLLPLGAAAALALASAVPAAALEHTRFEALWLQPATSQAGSPARGIPVLLNLPPGWMTGDAAVIVLDDPSWPTAARDGIVARLLAEQGAAVLEIGLRPASGVAPEPRVLLAAALLALRRDAGAGIVVGLGYGAGGEAALLAASESAVAAGFGLEGPHFAAGVALGPGRPAFAMGAEPAADEAWPMRAPLLCAALAAAGEAGRAGEGAASPAAMARDCTRAIARSAALDGTGHAALSRGRIRTR